MADKVLTTASGRQVKTGTVGVPGYLSSALLPSGEGTAEGDVFNQFRGYVGPQGGGFGGYDSAPLTDIKQKYGKDMTFKQFDNAAVDNARKAGIMSVKNTPAFKAQYGADLSRLAADDPDASNTKRKLAMGEPVSQAELFHYGNSRGIELEKYGTVSGEQMRADRTQRARDAGRVIDEQGRVWEDAIGSKLLGNVSDEGFDPQAAWVNPSDPNAPPGTDAPREPSLDDIFGRNASPTDNRPVMKASDTFESLQAQARQRMATPQMTSPTAKLPDTGTVPQNPFDQFNATGAPAPQTAGAPVAPTFAPDTLPPPDEAIRYTGPLSGGPVEMPPDEAVRGGRILNEPVSLMGSPSAGGMGASSSAGGNVAGGASFGARGAMPGGLRKLGRTRNPLMPDSRQNSGLFPGPGLKKIKPQQAPSPTGGPVPNVAAY